MYTVSTSICVGGKAPTPVKNNALKEEEFQLRKKKSNFSKISTIINNYRKQFDFLNDRYSKMAIHPRSTQSLPADHKAPFLHYLFLLNINHQLYSISNPVRCYIDDCTLHANSWYASVK